MATKRRYLKIREFLENIKRELVGYQSDHNGEPALFAIKEVTVEASIVTSYDASGKATIYVAGIGAKASQRSQHRVTVRLGMSTVRVAKVVKAGTIIKTRTVRKVGRVRPFGGLMDAGLNKKDKSKALKALENLV